RRLARRIPSPQARAKAYRFAQVTFETSQTGGIAATGVGTFRGGAQRSHNERGGGPFCSGAQGGPYASAAPRSVMGRVLRPIGLRSVCHASTALGARVHVHACRGMHAVGAQACSEPPIAVVTAPVWRLQVRI